MRRVLAAFADAAIVGLLSYGAFRVAFAVTPCKNVADCLPLAPAVLIAVLVVVVVFFTVSIRVLHGTPGQRLFHAGDRNT